MEMFIRVIGLMANHKAMVYLCPHLLKLYMMVIGIMVKNMEMVENKSLNHKIPLRMLVNFNLVPELDMDRFLVIIQILHILENLLTDYIMVRVNFVKVEELLKEYLEMGNSMREKCYSMIMKPINHIREDFNI